MLLFITVGATLVAQSRAGGCACFLHDEPWYYLTIFCELSLVMMTIIIPSQPFLLFRQGFRKDQPSIAIKHLDRDNNILPPKLFTQLYRGVNN
jgi:hypothetical protein